MEVGHENRPLTHQREIRKIKNVRSTNIRIMQKTNARPRLLQLYGNREEGIKATK